MKQKSFGLNSWNLQRYLAFCYLSFIAICLLCLSLPVAQKQPVSFIDNLFMATSAVTTTGLATVALTSSYSISGQIIILLGIQIGGFGYMIGSSYLMYNMTNHYVKIKREIAEGATTIPVEFDLGDTISRAVKFTLLFEAAGTVALFFLFRHAGVSAPLWNAAFHSISAFCTAGMSLFSDSLIGFQGNLGVCLTVALLAYAGAMGFILMSDIWHKITHPKSHICFTSRVILYISTASIIIAGVVIYICTPSGMFHSGSEKALVSFFQAVSAMTTLGFSSVNFSALKALPLLIIAATMFIGASPSGTGGGVKTTTVSAIFAFLKSKLGGQKNVTIGVHRLPSYRVDSAVSYVIIFHLILFVAVSILLCSDNFSFADTAFEAISAFGASGLSTGITPMFSVLGKSVLLVLMLLGRFDVILLGSFMFVKLKEYSGQNIKANIAL